MGHLDCLSAPNGRGYSIICASSSSRCSFIEKCHLPTQRFQRDFISFTNLWIYCSGTSAVGTQMCSNWVGTFKAQTNSFSAILFTNFFSRINIEFPFFWVIHHYQDKSIFEFRFYYITHYILFTYKRQYKNCFLKIFPFKLNTKATKMHYAAIFVLHSKVLMSGRF